MALLGWILLVVLLPNLGKGDEGGGWVCVYRAELCAVDVYTERRFAALLFGDIHRYREGTLTCCG